MKRVRIAGHRRTHCQLSVKSPLVSIIQDSLIVLSVIFGRSPMPIKRGREKNTSARCSNSSEAVQASLRTKTGLLPDQMMIIELPPDPIFIPSPCLPFGNLNVIPKDWQGESAGRKFSKQTEKFEVVIYDN